MKPFFRRWLFFVGAALISIASMIWMAFSEYHLATSVTFLVIVSSFVGAILLSRSIPSFAQGFSYGMMVGMLSLMVFGTCARVLQESDIEVVNAIVFMIFSSILALITGAGFDHFLDKDHPHIAELAIMGAGAALIPYILYGVLYFFGLDVYPFHYGVIIIVWQLAIGYSFSRDTKEDVLNSKYLNTLINKIGKKGG